MSSFNLSWFVGPFPGSGRNIDDPSWTIVAEKLASVLQNAGCLQLEKEDENEMPQLLEVRSENRAYLVTFGHAPSGDWQVLGYKNAEATEMDEPVEIGNTKWNRKCICYDPQVVISLFAEYFETQTVPAKLRR